MRLAITIPQMLVRLLGVVMLVLGGLFWSGNALELVPIHMLLGVLLVLALWSVAILAARSGVHPGLVALGLLWGLVVPTLGVLQAGLLPGPLHWLIQVLHLLVGLGAIGLAETLARRGKRRLGQRQAAYAQAAVGAVR
jgi:hypothetical protein